MSPRLTLSLLLLLGSIASAFPLPADSAGVPPGVSQQHGKHLTAPSRLWPSDGAEYYCFRAGNGSVVHVLTVDVSSGKWWLKPVVYASLTRASTAAQREHAAAAVNGGFFDELTGASVSYVVVDRRLLTNRRTGSNIKRRRDLSPYREAIFNRTEIRFLVDEEGKQSIQIARHKAPVPAGHKLVHSLQGGPQLLPTLTVSEEAFVRIDLHGRRDDPIRASAGAARTAFGIIGDGHAVIVCVEGPEQGKGSPGLSLVELARLLKALGCVQAVNLDGGHSTSMFIRTASETRSGQGPVPAGRVVCGRRPEPFVKSVLVLVPTAKR